MPGGKALRCRSAIAVVLAALSASLAQLPGQQANGGAESISPLIQALVDDNITLANLLLDAGADVAVLDTITPLYAAQEYVSKRKARHAMLRRLLAAGAQVDQTTQDGTTTLMLAAYHNRPRCIKELISNGADPLAHPEMMQPLKIAVEREYDECARLLIEAGADAPEALCRAALTRATDAPSPR